MLLTAGGCGIWFLIDLALIVCNDFKDKQGRTIELTKNPSSFKKVMMVFGAGIAGFICFFVLIIAILVFAITSMTDSARSQLHALQEGNVEKAYSFTSLEFQKTTSLDEFKKYVQQHPQLANSRSVSFTERSFVNDSGLIKGTLKDKDGSTIPIEYQLKKENGVWKIQAMRLSSHIKEDNSKVTRKEARDNFFSINYPSNWQYTHPDVKTMLFTMKSNNDSKYTAINIQKLLTKKSGGNYADLNDLKNDLMNQITSSAQNVTLLSEGEVELPRDPKNYHGISFVVTYVYQGLKMKKKQFLLKRKDEKFFYMWGYTSTIREYDANLPDAKQMYESWRIK